MLARIAGPLAIVLLLAPSTADAYHGDFSLTHDEVREFNTGFYGGLGATVSAISVVPLVFNGRAISREQRPRFWWRIIGWVMGGSAAAWGTTSLIVGSVRGEDSFSAPEVPIILGGVSLALGVANLIVTPLAFDLPDAPPPDSRRQPATPTPDTQQPATPEADADSDEPATPMLSFVPIVASDREGKAAPGLGIALTNW